MAMRWSGILGSAMVSGACAGLGSAAALALAARVEGKGAAQPMNATSHWRNGAQAAARRGVDVRHTVVGLATNHVASVFWAVLFEAWLAWRRPVGVAVLRDAIGMAAVAAAVDYGATPKRFTPGWEFVLSRKGMAVGYLGLALGMAAGSAIMRRR